MNADPNRRLCRACRPAHYFDADTGAPLQAPAGDAYTPEAVCQRAVMRRRIQDSRDAIVFYSVKGEAAIVASYRADLGRQEELLARMLEQRS